MRLNTSFNYLAFILCFLLSTFRATNQSNTARYDNYRLYHVQIETLQHVHVLQQLEDISDSCTFYGHARAPGQNLTIMVSAHKISDFADLLQHHTIKHDILVSSIINIIIFI